MTDDDRYKEMTIPHLVLLANSAWSYVHVCIARI